MDGRSLRSTTSQETLISLLHLDPTPITDKELPPLPEESSEHHGGGGGGDGSDGGGASVASSVELGHARTSSLGLSGSAANGSVFYCRYTPLLRAWPYSSSWLTLLSLSQ